MEKILKGNIWKYGLLLVANKRIFVAILGAYYLTIPNVNVAGIGIILLASNIAGFLFEIPSGYIADKIGHKQAIVISRFFYLASTVFFLVANNLTILILGGIALSAGNAFHSGTGSAFMHETLKGLKKEGDYPTIMGKLSSIGFAVPIVFMVVVPFLVDISFKLPFAIGLIIDIVGLGASISLVKPPVRPEDVEGKEIGPRNFKEAIKEGYRLNFFSFAIFSGIISGALLVVGGFRAPYQTFLEIPVIWYGVFFGIGRGLASLILAYTGRIKKKLSLYSFYKLYLVLYAVLILALAAAPTAWMVVAMFIIINAFHWGLSRVDNSYLVEILRASRFKATLLSVRAQVDRLVGAAAGFGIGFAIERLSYQIGFLILGVFLLVTLVPLYLFIDKRRKAGTYDNIVPSEPATA